jgi:hypothetical protein
VTSGHRLGCRAPGECVRQPGRSARGRRLRLGRVSSRPARPGRDISLGVRPGPWHRPDTASKTFRPGCHREAVWACCRWDVLGRRRTAGPDLDRVGDAGTGVLRVGHPDAVPGLDQPELDPLAPEGDDAAGSDVETDGAAAGVNFHLPADGIDPADDPVEVYDRPAITRYSHCPRSPGRDSVLLLKHVSNVRTRAAGVRPATRACDRCGVPATGPAAPGSLRPLSRSGIDQGVLPETP